jgi:hypothetical protein
MPTMPWTNPELPGIRILVIVEPTFRKSPSVRSSAAAVRVHHHSRSMHCRTTYASTYQFPIQTVVWPAKLLNHADMRSSPSCRSSWQPRSLTVLAQQALLSEVVDRCLAVCHYRCMRRAVLSASYLNLADWNSHSHCIREISSLSRSIAAGRTITLY